MSGLMSIRRPKRLMAIAALAAIGLTNFAGVASAHVSVDPSTAVAGSYTTLTFRVPNESARADTVKVIVRFPVDHPFASVSVRKQPGWTAVATTTKLATPLSDDDNASITQAVSSITWTADESGRIALGQFTEFEVSVGPVPKVASMMFETAQTYSDGSVAKWEEPTPATGVEPANPAPVLTISARVPATPEAASSPTPADNSARILGVVGIVVGALGLLVGAVALRGRPKVGS